MGDLQDPKMEVRKRTTFQAIFCWDISLRLKNRPKIWNRYLRPQSVPVAWPLSL